MITAKGTVIVGDKRYSAGETVTGLSKADIRRMARDGFIEVKEDKKNAEPKDNRKDEKKEKK